MFIILVVYEYTIVYTLVNFTRVVPGSLRVTRYVLRVTRNASVLDDNTQLETAASNSHFLVKSSILVEFWLIVISISTSV